MELLFTVLLAGLISCTHGQNQNGTLTPEEQKKCVGSVASTYSILTYKDGTILNNTNEGIELKVPTYQDQPNGITFPYNPDAYYTLISYNVTKEGCKEKVFTLWKLQNIVNLKIDLADVVFDYLPPTPSNETQRIVIMVGKQDKQLATGAKNQDRQVMDMAKQLKDDGVTIYVANYYTTEVIIPPTPAPPEPCPTKKPCEPCDNCKPLLPIKLPKLCLL